MQKIKYGVIGASGRMGNEIINVMNEKQNELVFKYDVDGEWQKELPEVLIDFSLPSAFDKTIQFALSFNCPLVCGTTGLNGEQLNQLKNTSQKIAIVQSFNFSVGIQMLIKCAQMLTQNLTDWDIEISETHHRFKKDKPSGTAIMLKNAIGKEVNISSLRLGNIPGDHEISFGGLGEVISIKHSATSRRTFAEGAVKSAYFLLNKKNGFYSFQDVLFT